MDEIISGFNQYQNSILEKIMEPLNAYTLCAMKIKQFKSRKASHEAIGRVLDAMHEERKRICEILLKEQSEI